MDEQEREKLFQEIRARIGDVELEERRLREEEIYEESMRKKDWHWSLKIAILLGIVIASYGVYMILARMGLIW